VKGIILMIKFLLLIYFAVFTWSVINPKDYFTWFLEVIPAIVALIILIFTYKKFKFTPLIYILILIHSIILMIGGHYTYAEVPLFDIVKDLFNQDRNNFDKIGHLAQGFVPAMVAREIIIRNNVIGIEAWRNFFIVCFALALSALYEVIEWRVALIANDAADDFLGTQGYIWDTQSDMAWALYGSILALIFLRKYHDKQLLNIKKI
jgi:putative membrane protein